MSSEPHRKVLQHMLDKAYVQPDLSPEKMASVMNIVAQKISFSEDEEVLTHRAKALHITVKCNGYIVARVLIDGGSALNVLPLTTFQQLSFKTSDLRASDVIVRAFDGSRREATGVIMIPVEIGPSTFRVEFQVMDVEQSYAMLLGRPWIHMAKAVPSTLHQRVKFIDGGRLITVKGEDEILVSKPNSIPYVEAAEQEIETAFQSLEIEGSSKGNADGGSKAMQIMQKSGYKEGKGLGAHLQGIKAPLQLPGNQRNRGIGYDSGYGGAKSMKEGNTDKKQGVPPISSTFSAPVKAINQPYVSMVTGEGHQGQAVAACIRVDDTGEPLSNWEIEDIIDIFNLE